MVDQKMREHTSKPKDTPRKAMKKDYKSMLHRFQTQESCHNSPNSQRMERRVLQALRRIGRRRPLIRGYVLGNSAVRESMDDELEQPRTH